MYMMKQEEFLLTVKAAVDKAVGDYYELHILRKEFDELQKKYDDLLNSSLKSAQEQAGATLQAILKSACRIGEERGKGE